MLSEELSVFSYLLASKTNAEINFYRSLYIVILVLLPKKYFFSIHLKFDDSKTLKVLVEFGYWNQLKCNEAPCITDNFPGLYSEV